MYNITNCLIQLTFNPLKDSLKNDNNEDVFFEPPIGFELPKNGFDVIDNGYQTPDSEQFPSLDIKDVKIEKDFFKDNGLIEKFEKILNIYI